jgi:hypothetical protein
VIDITASTTLAELSSYLKPRGLSVRLCQMGTGYMALIRDSRREGMGYGQELHQAIETALHDQEKGSSVEMPQLAPV